MAQYRCLSRLFSKGRLEIDYIKSGRYLGIRTCWSMEIYKPESERKLLEIAFYWIVITFTLRGARV